MNEETKKIFEVEEEVETSVGLPFKVILYNDDWHTFDEVISQIIKATQCNYEIARSKTFEVHVKGQSEIYKGGLNKCLRISSILEEIELHTQVIAE